MLHVQDPFPLQPPFLITTADKRFPSTCQMQFQDTGFFICYTLQMGN